MMFARVVLAVIILARQIASWYDAYILRGQQGLSKEPVVDW